MQVIKETISNLTLSNQQLQSQGGKGGSPKGNGVLEDTNLETGKFWKIYCWSCGCCTHWSCNCPKKEGTKMTRVLRIVWIEVILIADETSGERSY